MTIEAGLFTEASLTVDETMTASSFGGDRLAPVFSTPHLVGFMEDTAHALLLPYLEPQQSSVGSAVNIRHLAATPVGMQVRMKVELLKVDGRRLHLRMEAWDELDKIAEGDHERFIIDWGRFMAGVEKKRNLQGN